MKWWPWKKASPMVESPEEALTISKLLELEKIEEAEALLKQGVFFDDYVLVNLCRDNKKKSINLCLQYWSNLKVVAPDGFIASSLIFTLESENFEAFKSLISRNISHQNLIYEIINKQNVKPLISYWDLNPYAPRSPAQSVHLREVSDFLNKHQSLMFKLIKKAGENKDSAYFLDLLVCHQPSLYFSFNLEHFFQKFSKETKEAIIKEFNYHNKTNLSLSLPSLKGVHEGALFFPWTMEPLRVNLESLLGEKIHRPLLKTIAKDFERGDFSWVNCLYWARHLQKIPQDMLLNLGPFFIAKELENSDSFKNWELKILKIFHFLSTRTTVKQCHSILNTIKDYPYYIDDVYFYSNHRLFEEARRLRAKTFRDLHDELGLQITSETHQNFSLNQDLIFRDLHGKAIEGYTIRVPRESKELLLLGNELKICVGTAGYGRRCLEGSIYILILEKDQQKICVEYSRSRYKILQARSFFNKEEMYTKPVEAFEQLVIKAEIDRERLTRR